MAEELTKCHSLDSEWTKKTTVSIPDAGKIIGIGRDAAYEAAKRGELPTLEFGRLKRVPVAALRKMLGLDGTDSGDAAAR